MTRSQRLLALLDVLRNRRHPVTAAMLAERFGISERSVYRDIASLNQQGAGIEGSPGYGYALRAGFFLPPLSFDADEAAALLLGLRFVIRRGDAALARSAASAQAKLAAVAPRAFGDGASSGPPLLVGPGAAAPTEARLGELRRALDEARIVELSYRDARSRASLRRVWPVALGWFDNVELLAGWCESRGAYRHFRVDRIGACRVLDEHPPRDRRVMLAEYRRLEPGIQL
jgi:predicted DNA-binding transcriptional regulator YafY